MGTFKFLSIGAISSTPTAILHFLGKYLIFLFIIIDCTKHHFQTLSLPKIGSGLDGLKWNEVKSVIQRVFQDASVFIRIVKLPGSDEKQVQNIS